MLLSRVLCLISATGHCRSLALATTELFRTVDASIAAPTARIREQLLNRGVYQDFLTMHVSDHVDVEPWRPASTTDSPDAEAMWAASHDDLRVHSSIVKAEKRTVRLRHRVSFLSFDSTVAQASYELQDGSLVFDELSRTRGVPFMNEVLVFHRVRYAPNDASSCKIDGWVTLDMSKASSLAPKRILESNVVDEFVKHQAALIKFVAARLERAWLTPISTPST